MCLRTVDEKTRTGVKYGYKLFYVNDPYVGKGIIGEYYSANDDKPYRRKRWYKSSNTIITREEYEVRYESGFHVFTNKKEARDYRAYSIMKIFKVKVRNIVASGTQSGRKIVIAKEMLIIEEVK